MQAHAPLSDRAHRYTGPHSATLIYMPTEHEPVLAPELTALLAPQPGRVAIDCTFGGGGHARRIAAAIGTEGTFIGIDRDPAAQARFERFAAEVPCRTRFLSGDYSAGLRTLRGEGIRPDMVFMDLGMSSMQVDARERGFSYSYDAPLDMRMDTRQEFSAADLVNEWPESRIAQALRRFGEERYAGGIAREIGRRRPLRTTAELVDASAPATRPRRLSRPFASPSTASSTRSRTPCRPPGRCCRSAGAWRQSPSTRSRIAPSSASLSIELGVASAHPSFRSAPVGASQKPSCSPAERSRRKPLR
jgi:hypothetical protein